MKGKPKGGKVSCSNLAYPRNSFRFDAAAADSTSLVDSNKEPSNSADAGPLHTQSRPTSEKCDETYSLPEEDVLRSGGQNQQPHRFEKVIVEVLQKVEKDIQEMEHFSKQEANEMKNGPKKYCK